MSNQLKQNRWKIILFTGVSLACVTAAAVLQIPRWKIAREIRTFAEELPVHMEYAVPEQLSTKEEKLTALRELIKWEEETRTEINDAFNRGDEDPDEEETEETGQQKNA